jgi:hypothetical protein
MGRIISINTIHPEGAFDAMYLFCYPSIAPTEQEKFLFIGQKYIIGAFMIY